MVEQMVLSLWLTVVIMWVVLTGFGGLFSVETKAEVTAALLTAVTVQFSAAVICRVAHHFVIVTWSEFVRHGTVPCNTQKLCYK